MEFICSATEPIVQTAAGKIRGYKLNGIYTFLGVKYAQAKRFHQPQPVEPWQGVKDATQYGDTAPYMEKKHNAFGDIRINHRYWPQDEDCQYLNVWTDSLAENAKKPVLFWIHGGGYSTGSSVELVCYDGSNTARYGDVVLVSINHRLNIAGFLDLSAYGPEYAYSGTAGIADIVEALKWVRNNIARFGGDPDNVTIFGQSGGGGKVSTLLQTPAADGLFHKAIIMSGILPSINHMTQEDSHKVAAAVVEKLGLDKQNISQIETVPFEELVKAFYAAEPQLNAQGISTMWRPVQNGYYLGDPREVGFCEHAKTLPIMIGSTLGEIPTEAVPFDKMTYSHQERTQFIRNIYGEKTDELIRMFERAYPGKDVVDLAVVDVRFRVPTLDFVDLHAKDEAGNLYLYMFAYSFPLNDGEPAWHCAELPYVFHNIDYVPVCNTPQVGPRLQDQLFGAWTAFAHKGDPNNEHIPNWLPYTAQNKVTMVFDVDTQAKEDYDRQLVDLIG